VKMVAGTIATLAALVLGLLVGSAKNRSTGPTPLWLKTERELSCWTARWRPMAPAFPT